jgi:hypothetical protein
MRLVHIRIIDSTFFYGVFSLSNEVVHFLLTAHFFIWLEEWNELIHHHFIPHELIISICTSNELILPKFMR